MRVKPNSKGVNILEVFMPDYKAVIKEIESVEIIIGLRKPPTTKYGSRNSIQAHKRYGKNQPKTILR